MIAKMSAMITEVAIHLFLFIFLDIDVKTVRTKGSCHHGFTVASVVFLLQQLGVCQQRLASLSGS